jgi:hypothetical protein
MRVITRAKRRFERQFWRTLSPTKIVVWTLRKHWGALIANVTANNALLRRADP